MWNPDAPGADIPFALFRWINNYAGESDVKMARQRAKNPKVLAALAELGEPPR